MIGQPDLFAPPLVAGLRHVEALIEPREEAQLLAAIAAIELTPFRFQGWIGKRLTTSFGWRYDFDDASLAATTPLPEWLVPVRNRAAAFAGLAPDVLIQAMITHYDPGAGIGWHRDRPLFEDVIGVSLGTAAVLRLRRRTIGGFERRALPLSPRSAYHLGGEARHGWEHSIAPIDATRWSITFRSLSDKGLIAAERAAS
jgi:alkylated DNA repair dioxygenase AlkB